MTIINKLLNIFSKLLDFFEPKPIKINRERVGVVLITTLCWYSELVAAIAIDVPVTTILCFSAGIFNFLILFTRKFNLISSTNMARVYIVVSTSELLFTQYMGGLSSGTPTLIWMGTIPVVSIFILDFKEGTIWSAISMLTSFFLMYFNHRYNFAPNEYSAEAQYLSAMSNQIYAPCFFYGTYALMHFQKEKYFKSLTDKNEELLLLKEEKDKLLTILFHDLGRNSSMLSNYLELDDRQELTDKAKEKVYSLSNEIKSILKNAKSLDSKLIESAKQSISTIVLFKELKSLFELTLKKKEITFKFVGNGNLLLTANKSHLINHVLGNLLSNAIKFSHRNDEIIFKATDNDNKIKIEIIDNGTGYQEGIIKKGTESEDGSGNGLKIVKQFSRLNNLNFMIEPNQNEGTICSVTSS